LIEPAERFDLVVLAHVLEHVGRPQELLAKLNGYMRPGATLFVEVPNRDDRYKSNFESHLLFFDPESLGRLLQQNGQLLDVVSVGALAAGLRITQTFPERSVLRPLKEAVKTLIAMGTPRFYDAHIRRYQMSTYGGDRQWVRALVRRQ
jgi:SAM-dependent methyltransferase